MKDSRAGEHLWSEWDWDDSEDTIIYYTIGMVDIEHEIVKRALASALQRDGVVDSLGIGFKIVESCAVSYGWVGYLEDDDDVLVVCDEFGETFYGDVVIDVQEATFVEF